MDNLRIVDFEVTDSTNIIVTFTDKLDPTIGVNNVTITSPNNVPEVIVKKVTVKADTLLINTSPFTPQITYKIKFYSSTIKFRDITKTKLLFEDDSTNVKQFYGPASPTVIQEYLKRYYSNNIYDTESGLIGDYLKGFGIVASKALYDIRQIKNENYISNTIVDEVKVRSNTAFDRLNEEAAYQILRVAKRPSTTIVDYKINLQTNYYNPISLKTKSFTETVNVNNNTNTNNFNSNLLLLNLSKQVITKVKSITFTYTDKQPYYYPVSNYGYYLKDSKYDTDNCFNYYTLNDNQIKLPQTILSDSLFSLNNIFSVIVEYEYKNLGTIIDYNTLNVYTIEKSSRETLEPLLTILFLKGKNIIKQDGSDGEIGDISFVDPNTLEEIELHPAFKYEIKFAYDNLPSRVGEYAIDYTTGTVYVYGEDLNNKGSGSYPPLATYFYKKTYIENIDYVYDQESGDLIPLPNGNLINKNIYISFSGEETLVENVDYVNNSHIEVLNERINNNLLAKNVLRVNNYPITDVFEIRNETTGEKYNLTRYNQDKVYFSYITPPNIQSIKNERVTFNKQVNETLLVESVLSTTNPGEQIYKFKLQYQITSSTDDSYGSYTNNNVTFTDITHFTTFKYSSPYESETFKLNLVQNVGDYTIDFINGYIYCRVVADTFFDFGGITYSTNYIKTNNNHITSVEDVYYQINLNNPKDKSFEYSDYSDNLIKLNSLDYADEQYLNLDLSFPYLAHNSQVGVFDNLIFIPGVSKGIKSLRGVYEVLDLKNNLYPVNFAEVCTYNSNNIILNLLSKEYYLDVQFDGSYYVELPLSLSYLSSNLTYVISVLRLSDSSQLWDNAGTIVLGTSVRLYLSGINTPALNDNVKVEISISINDLSNISVDYNKGDMYVDYTYLADEILVSYEYGDNSLDFRKSSALAPGETYYVTYKTGALRKALLSNFGSLINIDLMNDFPIDLYRESYRDCVYAALQSFVAGPTLNSINNVVYNITKVKPDITEYVFQNWSLGQSRLNLSKPKTISQPVLEKAKFDNGILLKDDFVTIPVSSNIKYNSGTLETWIIPKWNGIDNDANITLSIKLNSNPIINSDIFVGSDESYVKYNDLNQIVLNKDIKYGIPNRNKNGVYIYYAKDATFDYDRWYIEVVGDIGSTDIYTINIKTDGKFYNPKLVTSDSNTSLTTYESNILFKLNGLSNISYVLNFVSDKDHYLVDFGDDKSYFSIFKDSYGYFNFKIKDLSNIVYQISKDISSWKKDEKHHIAASWQLSTQSNLDEMHLFIDGVEVYNLIKYSDSQKYYPHQKYRTISQEEFVGISNKSIYYFSDLVTTAGSNIVTSTQNFGTLNISIGDVVTIYENTFSTYTITSINGNNLTLSAAMPASITDGKFSINEQTINVNTNIDYKKFAVLTLSSYYDNNDLSTISGNNIVSATSAFSNTNIGDIIRISAIGFEDYYFITDVSGNNLYLSDNMPSTNSNLTYYLYHNEPIEIPGLKATTPSYSNTKTDKNYLILKNNISENDIILLRTLGINSKINKQKYYQWGNTSNILRTRVSPPIDINDVKITHVILDPLHIGLSNSTYVAPNYVSSNITTNQPNSSSSGRTLLVNITGDNIDFSNPTTVYIDGDNNASPTSETLTFSSRGSLETLNKYTSINYINVVTSPISSTKQGAIVTIKERYEVTYNEVSTTYPKIKFSYQLLSGNTLTSDGTNVLLDSTNKFSNLYKNNYLYIPTPSPAAGYYLITDVFDNSITVSTPVVADTNINFKILNVTDNNTGYQNGYFIFEEHDKPGLVYNLNEGTYEVEYETYLDINLNNNYDNLYIGSNKNKTNNINAIIDQFVTYDVMYTDTRIGEVYGDTNSITKKYNSLKKYQIESDMLCYLDFDKDIVNKANYYSLGSIKNMQLDKSVNDNFKSCVLLKDRPLVYENLGYLTKNEGSIEFWLSPVYNTYNDPNYRFYFSANNNLIEEVTSYNCMQLVVSNKIKKVISVNIKGDNKDYFVNGSIQNNIITLGIPLPSQNTKVIVTYVSTNTNGDSISIYKDTSGYLNYLVTANNKDYLLRCPIFWNRGTWHKIKATYKFNNIINGVDEIRLYVDGYERGNLLLGENLIYGNGSVLGESFGGTSGIVSTIVFKDTLNYLYFGSTSSNTNNGYIKIDNIRLSNVSRRGYLLGTEYIDVNYNYNSSYPMTKDLYTTLLSDFNKVEIKENDFVILKNKVNGQYDFDVNIYDLYEKTKDERIKNILESLITRLKPANSKVYIKYK